MKIKLLAILLICALALSGCGKKSNTPPPPGGQTPPPPPVIGGEDIKGDDSSFGEDLEDLGAYNGMFEGQSSEVVIRCESGSGGCYSINGNVITFTALKADSVYSISGKFSGSIVIDVGDAYKLELELCGLSLISDATNPITVLSGNEVCVQAKKNTVNYIYDRRAAIPETDTASHSGAIYSEVDLEISGKGKLMLVSENNNGIHSKKDLQVKNIDLTVSCADNALKGNDSITLENATAMLIATLGDGIKTTNSDISNKGNQRGTISVLSGSYDIFAAGDGIAAAYDFVIDGADAKVNIFTDKYSNYSKEITATSSDNYYISFVSQTYNYSVKYFNSEDDYKWANASHYSTVQGGRGKTYYYSFPKEEGYSRMQIYLYSQGMEQGQDENYAYVTENISVNSAYDTIKLTLKSGVVSYGWTNYSSAPTGGPGGSQGNPDKGNRSTKGIKASNEVRILSGTLNIKSYDDAIHADNEELLENENAPTGDLIIRGGNITVYSNDDGLHADGDFSMYGGTVKVVNSYEGVEGTTVKIFGGDLSIISRDDGINASDLYSTSITIAGGNIYVFCSGDGLDSNSRTSYAGISFNGGNTLIISTSGGNSAIDTEQGYTYIAGKVVAIMPRGGMANESTKCKNFASVGKSFDLDLTKGGFLGCQIGDDKLTVCMPASIPAKVITLGSSSASASTNVTHTLAEGEFIWE